MYICAKKYLYGSRNVEMYFYKKEYDDEHSASFATRWFSTLKKSDDEHSASFATRWFSTLKTFSIIKRV